MKKTIAILILSMICLCAEARKDSAHRITFGAEWSYVGTFFTGYHYNYFTPDGYRFNVTGYDSRFYNNGEALVHIGYDINDLWNISAYAGMTGLADFHNAVPINIRVTRLWGCNPLIDRWFTFADIGTGITIRNPIQANAAVKLGGGYRLALSRDTKIDFLAALRGTYTQPQVHNRHELISIEATNRNDAFLLSISVGISLTFK